MPIYDYVCGACGHLLEVVHGIHAEGPRFCPSCGTEGRMKKVFAPPAVVFKGSGWAKKDRVSTASSKRKSEGDGTTESKPASSGGGSDAAPSTSSSKTKSDGGASSSGSSSSTGGE